MTNDNKIAYVKFRIDLYRANTEWRTDTLSEYFADDFHLFTAAGFKIIDSDSRRAFRDIMCSCGVSVSKGRNVLVGDALFAVVQGNLPWPADQLPDSGESTTADTDNFEEKQE